MSSRLQRLRLETERHVIEGSLQLPTEGFRSRIKDFLSAHADEFLALTDAQVTPIAGGPATTHPFLAVSTRHVVLVAEVEPPGGAADA